MDGAKDSLYLGSVFMLTLWFVRYLYVCNLIALNMVKYTQSVQDLIKWFE